MLALRYIVLGHCCKPRATRLCCSALTYPITLLVDFCGPRAKGNSFNPFVGTVYSLHADPSMPQRALCQETYIPKNKALSTTSSFWANQAPGKRS